MEDAKGIRAGVAAWERFLRLDRLTRKSDLIRARLVYAVCLIFIGMQVLNMGSLYSLYGSFHTQHAISITVCTIMAATVALLRVTTHKTVLAVVFSVLIIGAFTVATLNSSDLAMRSGVNSSLLPMLIVGVALVGWIGDRRVAVAYFVATLVVLAVMHGQSTQAAAAADYPQEVVDAIIVNTDQRAIQAVIALIVAGLLAALFGDKFYSVVDELEASAHSAREIERLKSAFHANMTHEIRSPLNGIIGMSEVLSLTDLDPKQAECASIISEAGQNLSRIIDEVLDISKVEQGMLTLDTVPFDLNQTLQGIVALHQAEAASASLWLGVDWQAGLPSRVVGDEHRLRQVIGNLVGNALKFTENGGVRIGVRGDVLPTATHARIQIFVQDTGPGIAAEDQKDVFERYGQSAEGRRKGSRGTGLGLSIASDIVSVMGGTLGLTSKTGHGATFHFTVDMELATERDAVSPPERRKLNDAA